MDDNKPAGARIRPVAHTGRHGTTPHVTPPHTSLSRHTCNPLFIVGSAEPGRQLYYADHSTKQGTSTTRWQRDCKALHRSRCCGKCSPITKISAPYTKTCMVRIPRVYLGGTVSADQSCDKDIERRIGLAAEIVRKLGKIWTAKDISKVTKVTLCKTLVQSVVLYNAETWTLKQEHQRKLRVFEMAVLRRICGVTRKDRKRNTDIMNALDIDEDVVELLQKRRLTYFGHVSRMQPERYPHTLLHGYISGSRPQGRPRKKWIDNVKEDCNRLELTLTEAARAAQD